MRLREHPAKGDRDTPYTIGTDTDGAVLLIRGRRRWRVESIDHIDDRWPGPVKRALAIFLAKHEPQAPGPRSRVDPAWARAFASC